MKPANVLREHGGGMEDLLRLLLVRNDPGPHSGWGISDAAYRLGQEVRKSDEWLRLGEAIAEAQRQNIEADGFRIGGKQAESSPAQNSDETTKSERTSYQQQIEKYSRWNGTQLAVRFGKAGQYVKELCEIERKLNSSWSRRPETALELRKRTEEYAQILIRDLTKQTKSPHQATVVEFRDVLVAEFGEFPAVGVGRSDTTEVMSEPTRAQNNGKTAVSAEGKPGVSRNPGGRPRKDTERQLIREKKGAGKSWKEITNEVNQETGQQKTADAYRSLLRSRSGNAKPPGKNAQN